MYFFSICVDELVRMWGYCHHLLVVTMVVVVVVGVIAVLQKTALCPALIGEGWLRCGSLL